MDMNSTEIYGTQPKTSLWTTSDLAGFLGCSERQVYNLRKQGLPALHVGGMIRFDPQAVREWLTPEDTPVVDDERARQLAEIAASGDEDNAEAASADLAREFPH
jgi:phage terminase Nu1 subunit (DNA packaging protein)